MLERQLRVLETFKDFDHDSTTIWIRVLNVQLEYGISAIGYFPMTEIVKKKHSIWTCRSSFWFPPRLAFQTGERVCPGLSKVSNRPEAKSKRQQTEIHHGQPRLHMNYSHKINGLFCQKALATLSTLFEHSTWNMSLVKIFKNLFDEHLWKYHFWVPLPIIKSKQLSQICQ